MFVKLCSLSVAIVLLIVPSSLVRAQSIDTKASATATISGANDYHTNPKFVDALKKAQQLEQRKQAESAGNAYKKANKIAGGRCVECLDGLYHAQVMEGSYKDAIGTSTSLEALAANPATKSMAAYDHGYALMAVAGEKAKPAQLEAAHAKFQGALALNPKNASALFFDGKVLAQLGKMQEASNDFRECLSCIQPTDPARLRVEHFAEDPELATHKMAPAFQVTALDGSKFNLDAMGGRVVLIDFWATWCGPCIEELPHMQKIAKEFAGDPLVIISVSWDNDDAKWKQFIQKNDMTWVQYRDADHKLANEFGINAIPYYFTIDSDGVLTAEMLGSGSNVEGKLKKLIAKARAAKVQTPNGHTQDAAATAGN